MSTAEESAIDSAYPSAQTSVAQRRLALRLSRLRSTSLFLLRGNCNIITLVRMTKLKNIAFRWEPSHFWTTRSTWLLRRLEGQGSRQHRASEDLFVYPEVKVFTVCCKPRRGSGEHLPAFNALHRDTCQSVARSACQCSSREAHIVSPDKLCPGHGTPTLVNPLLDQHVSAVRGGPHRVASQIVCVTVSFYQI